MQLEVAPADGVEQQSSPVDPRAEDNLDRNGSSGSLSGTEAWVDANGTTSNDGRSKTRTTFYPWDANSSGPSQKHRDPDDRRSWDELAKWNDGMYTEGRRKQNFDADVRRWTKTFCAYLELPAYQRNRVLYVMRNLVFDDIKQHHLTAEKVILGAISLVVDDDTDVDDIEEWDVSEWVIYDDDFESLMDDVDMDRSDLWTARKVVHDASSYFS